MINFEEKIDRIDKAEKVKLLGKKVTGSTVKCGASLVFASITTGIGTTLFRPSANQWIVSMGRGVGDGKVVYGGAILGIVISDMVAFRRCDIGDGKMTSGVMIADAITFNIVGSRRGDIIDDDEVTCGVVVSSREGRGDGRLVDSGVVSGVVISGLGEGDGRGEGGSVEASGANEVDDVDGANMVSGGCIDRQSC
uniref:Uncharacterized protein n=1 Tax=Vitis vinifera TaxID=29760 RepID=A5C9M6_VITVI|nr:hypothetical protein VITISV_014080 [Vitis vinifera]